MLQHFDQMTDYSLTIKLGKSHPMRLYSYEIMIPPQITEISLGIPPLNFIYR